MNSEDERLEAEATPKKSEVATRCENGHLILPERNGCLAGGCEYMDSDFAATNPGNVITE